MKLSRILPTIAATLTNHDRYLVKPGRDFEWSSELWTHNVFRFLGMIFGERYGIRPSVCSWNDAQGNSYQVAYTFEAQCALFETWVRTFSKKFAFKVVLLPQLQLAGMNVGGLSPYRFAIAFDSATGYTQTASLAHTCTGSNAYLAASVLGDITSDHLTGVTYNSVAMTVSAKALFTGDRWVYVAQQTGPTTGSSLNVVTTGLTFSAICAVSYTGCAQSAQPDSHNAAFVSGASTTISMNTTVVAANCWMFGCSNGGGGYGAGSGVLRGTASPPMLTGDSNATVGTGSTNMTFTQGNSAYSYAVISFSPASAAAIIHSLGSLGAGA